MSNTKGLSLLPFKAMTKLAAVSIVKAFNQFPALVASCPILIALGSKTKGNKELDKRRKTHQVVHIHPVIFAGFSSLSLYSRCKITSVIIN